MGKLIRNGIEYGGGNGTDIYEVTQSQYNTLKQAGTLVRNALYVITDAENLNCTAEDIEYSTGVSVKTKIDSKQNTITTSTGTITPNTTDGWSVSTLACYKTLNIVNVCIEGNKSSALVSGWNTIATLPSGFIPNYNIATIFYDPQNDFAVEGKITTSGQIQVYKVANSSQRIRCFSTFIIPIT